MNTMVEQRQEKQEHNDSCLVDHVVFDDVPENLVFDILVRLPLETLCSSRSVCKSWLEIISSLVFKNAHLRRSDTTTRGLIFLTPVENNLSPPPPKKVVKNHMVYIKFMEIKDGKSTKKEYETDFNGRIVAACNGLIVLERNPTTAGLVLHNPVTREDEDIPLGSISSTAQDSYGLAFCHASRRYKLLHLFFKDKLRNIGCEIMDFGSGSWRAVDMPPAKEHYICLQNPVFAMGALHWIQYVFDHDGPCMVSMPLDDEKFKIMGIPETGGKDLPNNSVFAMGEFVGHASRLEGVLSDNHQIGVWILRGLGGECGWEKQYTIDVASGLDYFNMTILLCYGGDNGHVFIFKCGDGCLYAYDDRHSQHMRKIKGIDNVADIPSWWIFPHVNSLASWRGEHF